jgi:hypothetical protein
MPRGKVVIYQLVPVVARATDAEQMRNGVYETVTSSPDQASKGSSFFCPNIIALKQARAAGN